jgi:hypothetical protein
MLLARLLSKCTQHLRGISQQQMGAEKGVKVVIVSIGGSAAVSRTANFEALDDDHGGRNMQ